MDDFKEALEGLLSLPMDLKDEFNNVRDEFPKPETTDDLATKIKLNSAGIGFGLAHAAGFAAFGICVSMMMLLNGTKNAVKEKLTKPGSPDNGR